MIDKLFYKLMYDKRLKRTLSMFEVLYKASGEVSVKHLEEQLNISRKTVISTLNYGKTLLPDTITLVVSEDSALLYSESSEPIDVAIIEIAKTTTSFRILKHAFYDEDLKIHELADEVFLSESSLRIRISHMNTILSSYDIRLTYYDVKLVGDEANIRLFYYTYFSEFQELFNSVLEEGFDYCTSIYNDILKMTLENGTKLLNYSYLHITRWLFVTINRMEVGKIIELNNNFVEQMKKRNSYKEFNKIYIRGLSQHLTDIIIPESEIVWAYIIRMNPIVYERRQDRELQHDENDFMRLRKKIDWLISDIMFSLEIIESDRNDFLEIHRAYLLNLSLLIEISPLFQRGSPTVIIYVKENLVGLFDAWCDSLSSNNDEQFAKITDVFSVATQLAMISSQFISKDKRKAKRVLFSFEGEATFAAYLADIGKSLLPSGVEGVFIFNEPVTQNLYKRNMPDIIVCNYKIAELTEETKVLRMSLIPEQKEWKLLKELLIDLDFNYF